MKNIILLLALLSVLPSPSSAQNETFRLNSPRDGFGIPEEIKDKILQPFFTTRKGTEGTGLGLSITNDIVKAHGGTLDVRSNRNGTIFSIAIATI